METGLQKTLKLLKRYEGFRDTVYLDANGIPAIGYGFTDPALIKKGKITLKEADSRLTKEIATRYNTLKDTLPNFEKLSDDSKAALISYHFNYPAGFKDTTKFMKYWNAGDYEKAIKEVDAGMNDPNNPGLRPRRLEELAMLSSDPFLSGIIATRKKDGNKILKFPIYEQKPFESTWKPEQPTKTIYPLNNTTPESISSWSGADAPNATPRLKDFLEVRQEDLNRGVNVYGDPLSPFNLRLSLPKLSSLLLLNTPLRQAELYFADVLGLSDLQPLMPSLFPRFKCGKLPKYGDGETPKYATVELIPEIIVTPDPELRLRINLTWPDKDVRLQVFYEINKYKKIAERYPHVYYVGNNLTSSDIGPDTHEAKWLPANYEIERLMNIVNASGNPETILYDNKSNGNEFRSGANGKNGIRYHYRLTDKYPSQDTVIKINKSDIRDPYMSELSHAFLYKTGLINESETKPELLLNMGTDPRDKEGHPDVDAYRTADNLEYAAHNVIQPNIYEYLRNNKSLTKLKSDIRALIDLARRYPQNAYDEAVKWGAYSGSNWYVKPTYKDGKSPIHIKPANRGKLTRLKKRTGKSEAELYRTGGPSVRKMITFARNARKWKH